MPAKWYRLCQGGKVYKVIGKVIIVHIRFVNYIGFMAAEKVFGKLKQQFFHAELSGTEYSLRRKVLYISAAGMYVYKLFSKNTPIYTIGSPYQYMVVFIHKYII